MELTPRIRQILLIMLKEKDIVPVKILADKVGVSKRTIQRELDYIEYALKKYSLRLCSKTGAGIWLEGFEEDMAGLQHFLENQEVVDSADKEVRRKRLIMELLKDQTPKKLYYYANLFEVSEGTIGRDIEKTEPWFNQFHLKISKKQGLGVEIHGDEQNIRTAIREFIAVNMDLPLIRGEFEEKYTSVSRRIKSKSIKDVYNLLDDKILQRVCMCFSSIQDTRIAGLTDESYIGLVLHVTIAVERVLLGEILDENEELKRKQKKDEDYNLSLQIVNFLEEEFAIEIPDIEVIYICLHIKASKVQRCDETYKDEILNQEKTALLGLVREMIIVYDRDLSNVLETDEEFVAGLASHLGPTLIRLQNGMQIENPHLDEIRESYKEIYTKCEGVGRFLKDCLGYEVPPAEIGFLAIHFGAAMVRRENEREKKRIVDIGVVCASGIGISRLMSLKLQRFLGNRANIATYGKADLTPFNIRKNDFFVSSMDLKEADADIIYVSPLLPESSLIQIEEKVKYYALTVKEKGEDKDFARKLEKINYLAVKIKELLTDFRCILIESELDMVNTVEIIAKQIAPYEVNQQKIKEDILKREQIATQVIPELGIALFHARSAGVFRPEFYVCTPMKGGAFIHSDMGGANVILIMLIPNDEHKEVNSSLLGFITENLAEQDSFLEKVKSGNAEEIKTHLTVLLKRYFDRYLDIV